MDYLDELTRHEFFEIFERMREDYARLNQIVRQNASPSDYATAKAYWLNSLNAGITASNCITHNITFERFLKSNGIIDENGDFIKRDSNDEGWVDEETTDVIDMTEIQLDTDRC